MRRSPPEVRLAILAAAVLGITACTQGAYPLDFFNEMHYQASQRREQPERLAPPPDAVPVTGRRPATSFEQATLLQNPVEQTPASLDRAHALYRVNCVACHGQNGDGQGVVASYFQAAGFVSPVAFNSERVRGRTDGQLQWLITYGIGNMPSFRHLLNEQDVWTLVLAVREFGGQ